MIHYFILEKLLIIIALGDYSPLSLWVGLNAFCSPWSKTAASITVSDAAVRFDHSAIPSETNTAKTNRPQVTAC